LVGAVLLMMGSDKKKKNDQWLAGRFSLCDYEFIA
jgi:hypothetical protein